MKFSKQNKEVSNKYGWLCLCLFLGGGEGEWNCCEVKMGLKLDVSYNNIPGPCCSKG